MTSLITIVLPVFGRPDLLQHAISSIYLQTDTDWRLHIADDGSDPQTVKIIEQYLSDPRISYIRRSKNLGLFKNLNRTLSETTTPWQLLLCSDDELKPAAVSTLKAAISEYPDVRLFLSSYESIDVSGQPRWNVNSDFYDQFAPDTKLFEKEALLLPLLKYGSINGNITGMLFHKSLFNEAGPWRADWIQAADWEWLTRSCMCTSVLVRRDPIASVRVHDRQLSVSNQRSEKEFLEVMTLLGSLVRHPYLLQYNKRYLWAAYHAQFQLWNTIKRFRYNGLSYLYRHIILIHKNIGLLVTVYSLVTLIPSRLIIRGTQRSLLPPH